MSLDFASLNARLLNNVRSLLPSWLPGGRIQGHEYVCANFAGGPGRSLSVNINTGRWGDFSTDLTGGDLISLYAAIHGIDQGKAFRALDDGSANLFSGSSFSDSPVAPNPPTLNLGPPPADTPLPDLSAAERHWVYRTPEGDPWFIVARFPQKQIRPYAWDLDAKAWVPRSVPRPRPLYNLPGLLRRPDAPVLVVEGEKAASAAHKLCGEHYVVTTWPNGAAAVSAADWAPLHGRRVLIWADADEPGIKAAQTIASLIHGHCPEVKVILPLDAELPAGFDADDALQSGWDYDQFMIWARALAIVWHPPVEVIPEVLPAIPSLPAAPVPPTTITLAISEDQGPVPTSLAVVYETYGIALNGRGSPFNNAHNAHQVLSRVPGFTDLAYYDEFYGTIFKPDNNEWTDADTSRLLVRFQGQLGFRTLSSTALLDALVVYAREHTKNAPRDWMDTLIWDQKPRLTSFLPTYMGSEDSDYTQAAGRNWWISMVARIYRPGCKVDTMLILQGEQGRFKSTAFSVIGGSWYAVATADVDDPKAFAETMRGKMILELAELASFGKAESASIKRLITTQTDRFRASYGHFAEDHPRRCVLVGTTNLQSVHNDETGGRRFNPVWINSCDLDALARDREQLFAEAVHLFKSGATWWDMPESALAAQEAAREHDELEPIVQDYLSLNPSGVTIHEVWCNGLKFSLNDMKRHEQLRLAKIMRSLRWQSLPKPIKREGRAVRLWLPMDAPF